MFCNSGAADDEVSVFFKVASTSTGFLDTLKCFGSFFTKNDWSAGVLTLDLL